ncbi:MAG: Tex-like N-terminal domain-containing protein, partial [Isosphaeraceae bacterium]
MDNPIPVDLGRVAQDLQIRRVQVESVVQLLDEGNTVPFITRYRKERTGNLNEVVIREIQLRVHRLRELAERKETILKAIEAQGKLNPEL